MKGIILAGGSGTRLHPLTLAMKANDAGVWKAHDLLPVVDFDDGGYQWNFDHFTPHDLPNFRKLLEMVPRLDVNQLCRTSYSKWFSAGVCNWEEFIGKDDVALVLGDNIFFGSNMQELLRSNTKPKVALSLPTMFQIQSVMEW
jgi:glucose-1-phosphate thymidylyltransferase